MFMHISEGHTTAFNQVQLWTDHCSTVNLFFLSSVDFLLFWRFYDVTEMDIPNMVISDTQAPPICSFKTFYCEGQPIRELVMYYI